MKLLTHYRYNITIEAKNTKQMSRISYNYKGGGDISLYIKSYKFIVSIIKQYKLNSEISYLVLSSEYDNGRGWVGWGWGGRLNQ